MTRAFSRLHGRGPVPRPDSMRPGKLASGRGRARRRALAAARTVVAAGLAIDAYVHVNLASTYAEGGGTINEGVLFRAEAAVALAAAIAVTVTGRRVCYLAGFTVASTALAVMLVSRYADLGAIGPFPDLYDPVWFPEKLLAASAEGAAALAALIAVVLCRPRERPSSPSS
jgi:predicted acyltransferase